jgi:hypothetical protein
MASSNSFMKLAYRKSVVPVSCPFVPEIMHKVVTEAFLHQWSWKVIIWPILCCCNWGFPPSVKLESCHMTYTVLLQLRLSSISKAGKLSYDLYCVAATENIKKLARNTSLLNAQPSWPNVQLNKWLRQFYFNQTTKTFRCAWLIVKVMCIFS